MQGKKELKEGPRIRESETLGEASSVDRLTKQIAKGGGIAFAGQIAGRFFTLLLQILLTRVLGAASYGLYALGFSVLGIAQTVSLFGLQNGVVRFGAMYRGEGDRACLKGTLLLAIGMSFSLALVVAITLYFLAGVIAKGVFHEPSLVSPLRAFAFALPFYTLVTISAFSARAFRRIDYDVAVSQLFRPLATLIAVGGSFLLGFRLMGAVYGFLFSTVIAAGLGLYLLYRLFPDIASGLRARWKPKTLLLYSGTVLLAGMSGLLLKRTDRIMLGILSSAESVGIYSAAANLAAQAALFLTSFNAIFSPIISDLFHRGRMKELGTLFETTTKWIFTLTLPVALILVLFARPIMRVFGPGFAAGGSALIALGVAQLVNAGVGSVGFMLTMTGRQKIALVNSLALGGLNVLLNLLLIPRYGVLGAAVATGISIALINVAKLIEVYWLYKLHPYKLSYWKPLAAAAVAIASCLGLRKIVEFTGWWQVGEVILVSVVYLMVLVYLGLEEEDRVVLLAMKTRFLSRP